MKIKNEKHAKTILDAIAWYQQQSTLHPLTCGKNSTHKLLVATKKGDEIVLHCLDCDYIQENIPSDVIAAYRISISTVNH